MLKKNLATEIVIHSTPEAVWSALIDFHSYPQWNPFLRSIKGAANVGQKLKILSVPPGFGELAFAATIVAIEPPRRLIWQGRFLFPGLVDGLHTFNVEAIGPDRVRFTQSERLAGLLLFTVPRSTLPGYRLMNAALKQRVETLPIAAPAPLAANPGIGK